MNGAKTPEANVILLLTLACFAIGLGASVLLQLSGFSFFPFSMHPVVNSVLAAVGVFVLSMLFFGYLTPVLFFLMGLLENSFIEEPINLLLIIPFIIAGYAGTVMGVALFKDMRGKDNFTNYKWKIISLLAISLVLAAAIPSVLPAVFG